MAISSWRRPTVPALLAMLVLSGCATLQEHVKEPEVRLHDVRVTAMSFTDATLAFDMDVLNPNPLGISMQGLSYRLEMQDKTLFDGRRDDGLRIASKGSSRVTLPFTVNYRDMFDSLSAMKGQDGIKYRLSGDVKFGPFTIPYATAGTLPVPSLPTLDLEGLKVERLTLSGATLALGIRVGNGNQFPLKFSSLDYALTLGSTSVLQGRTSKALEVAPDGSDVLWLSVKLDYGRVVELAQALRNAQTLPVGFTGKAKIPSGADVVTLPYSWSGDLPLFR